MPFVGALVVAALLVDLLVLLPTFEAGGGDMPNGAKVLVWILVNSVPAIAAVILARSASRRPVRVLAAGLAVAAITGLGLLLVVFAYFVAEADLS